FQPAAMGPEALQRYCLEARRSFYAWSSIAARALDPVNSADMFMFRNFFPINAMLRVDTNRRDGYPLGDESWQGPLLPIHLADTRIGAGVYETRRHAGIAGLWTRGPAGA